MLEKLPDVIGQVLSDVRSGLTQTLQHRVDLRQGMHAMVLRSVAFEDHAELPRRYSADGDGFSPPLQWSGVPAQASEVVLIVEDADSPTPQPLVLAIAHGLLSEPPQAPLDLLPDDEATAALGRRLTLAGALAEGALCEVDGVGPLVPMGLNSLMQSRWLPPDPPPGHGVHRYVFQVFALGPGEALPQTPGRDALAQAIAARGLASGCLIGVYERPSGHTPATVSISGPMQTA